MRHRRQPDHGIETAPLDHLHEVQGINPVRVKRAAGAVGAVVFVLLAVWIIQKNAARQHRQPPEPQTPPAQTQTQTQEPLKALREALPSTYAGQDRTPKEPRIVVKEVQAATLQPDAPPPPVQHTAALPPTQPPPVTRQALPPATAPGQRPAATATPTEKPKPWWVAGGERKQRLGKPPFAEPKLTEEQQKPQAGTLIPPVVWEVPQDRNRVIYRDRVIHGELMGAVNSDIPGDILIKVTRHVTSRFDAEIILLPQETHLIGVQDGKPEFGQRRLPIKIVQAILPDGEVMAFEQARVADRHGAAGMSGKVNNHLPQLLLATGLTALLNIGARAPFGDTQGYQATLPQQYGQDVAQGISQAGKPIIQKQVGVSPTITEKAGAAVTITLGQNVSLQTPPKVIQQ